MRLDPVISLMAFATVLAVSCVKTQILPDGARDRHAVTFTAAVGPQGTKAVIEGNVFSEDYSFATLAWWLEEGNWDSDRNSAQLYIPLGSDAGSRSVVSYDEDLKCWTTGIPYYWPSRGSLTFFSFYPHDMADVAFKMDTDEGLVIGDRDVSVASGQQEDVMVAEVAKDRTANSAPSTADNQTQYTGVPTVFRHTLSRLTGFTVRTDEDCSTVQQPEGTKLSFTLNSIKVSGVFVKGSYRSGMNPPASGEWFQFSEPVAYEWYDGDDYADAFQIVYGTAGVAVPGDHIRIGAGTEEYSGSVLILPQKFDDPDFPGNHGAGIEVTYTVTYGFPDGTAESRRMVRTIKLADIHKDQGASWPVGKNVSYDLTIGIDKITWQPSVEDRVEEIHSIGG